MVPKACYDWIEMYREESDAIIAEAFKTKRHLAATLTEAQNDFLDKLCEHYMESMSRLNRLSCYLIMEADRKGNKTGSRLDQIIKFYSNHTAIQTARQFHVSEAAVRKELARARKIGVGIPDKRRKKKSSQE